jgi:hypothetical protein
MRSAQFLDAAAQHRLLRLLRWRDVQARSSDRPRSWILDNELAATLARTPPADDALGKLFEQFPKAPRKLAGAVWQALSTPLADEADAPLALPANDSNKQALKKLQDAVAERSRELGLPDGILASRKHLESYLERRQWPAALAGWRQQELESRLQALLPGTSNPHRPPRGGPPMLDKDIAACLHGLFRRIAMDDRHAAGRRHSCMDRSSQLNAYAALTGGLDLARSVHYLALARLIEQAPAASEQDKLEPWLHPHA